MEWEQQVKDRKQRTKPKKPKKPKEEPKPRECQLPAFEAFYDQQKKSYWVKNSREEWISVSEDSLNRKLRKQGFAREMKTPLGLTWTENELERIQTFNDLQAVGAVGGYPSGVHEICGVRCLVTNGPRIIEPKKGTWDTLDRFLDGLIGKWGDYVLGWLQVAFRGLVGVPPWPRGQALILAGPPRAGKNEFQRIVTDLLGGRSAKPYRYLTGQTQFNKDLIGAEHLVIQDDVEHVDMKSRRAFGSKLKDLIVNETQSLHCKGRDALTMDPFSRVSISCNEEPENLQVLPPLESDIVDKLIMIRCGHGMPDFLAEKKLTYQTWRQKVTSEYPAFLDYLLRWSIPTKLQDVRFGIASVLDESLTQEIQALSPEMKLLSIMDQTEEMKQAYPYWEGSALDVELLLRKGSFGAELGRMLPHSSTCGSYLSKLARDQKKRVERVKAHGNVNRYRIYPAPKLAAE